MTPASVAERIRGPLSQALEQLISSPDRDFSQNSWVDEETGVVNWNQMVDLDTHHAQPLAAREVVFLTEQLHAYLNEPTVDVDSDAKPGERSDIDSVASSDHEQEYHPAPKRRVINLENPGSKWFPWPDKETCVLDILRHVPRCSFSKKQNTAIHWAMLALGLRDLPSDRVMDDIDKVLQPLCGIQSIRYSGKLGHVYYTNDLAAIIAQEMANPAVRDKLRFLPEDSGPSLSQAWQASRWLHELDSDLTTPMIRLNTQDYFIHEPALLSDGSVCMPTRWFERDNEIYARVWKMQGMANNAGVPGWVVNGQATYDVKSSNLLLSFPHFVSTHGQRQLPDPRIIHGIQTNPNTLTAWTKTDATQGNRWRKQAVGHRVVAFPVWLYCDDTSGNTSKKWNKHNSFFLFTAAGLPRKYVHQESNIHFLSTSNIAPPLEMLDGIVDQLKVGQERGIWVWDSHHRDLVLVIPSVLAMLGDNPMQSEFACHIGFCGKFFCRACWVQGDPEKEDDDDGGDYSDAGSLSDASVQSNGAADGKKKKRGKKKQTIPEMISRIQQFMTRSTARNCAETQEELKAQFNSAIIVGGQAEFKRRKTKSGIKDTFQGAFLERIFAISTKRGRSKPQKQADVTALRRTFPADITSPVWRIKDLDPHQDTPVEILHVVLLGFVKYFWRDAVARLKKKEQKDILIARLSSFNVSGLGIPPLSGHTLVNYAGLLTGRDFRALVQVAPFVLQGLLPDEKIHAWVALSAVVTLVWQPHIQNLDRYIITLETVIDHFLDCTCRLTLNWFNKPKFHVILHLPAHIRRFGPAMLFATEGFESFNAIIRACSVHSNRHAPSRDIAARMARGNRLRHLLSGGSKKRGNPSVSVDSLSDPNSPVAKPAAAANSESAWMKVPLTELQDTKWVTAAAAPLELLEVNSFGSRLLGFNKLEEVTPAGTCRKIGAKKRWSTTLSSQANIFIPPMAGQNQHTTEVVGDSVVYDDATTTGTYRRIGNVVEIIQIIGSVAQESGQANFILVSRTIVGEAHTLYCMKQVQTLEEVQCLKIEDIQCTINIQHNCADNNCRVERSKTVFQEREKATEKALAVTHGSHSNDWVINTAQMRDAAMLETFRFTPERLVRADIIRASAQLEFAARKQKAAELKAAEALLAGPTIGPTGSAVEVGTSPIPGTVASTSRPHPASSLRNVLNTDTVMHE
ncbi:hypothetical protein C8R46DRAFT_1213111 [Mycena filopes]|nr:hypothetical protein C8R46DRAFT_1213111 [Mycena filopes]